MAYYLFLDTLFIIHKHKTIHPSAPESINIFIMLWILVSIFFTNLNFVANIGRVVLYCSNEVQRWSGVLVQQQNHKVEIKLGQSTCLLSPPPLPMRLVSTNQFDMENGNSLQSSFENVQKEENIVLLSKTEL